MARFSLGVVVGALLAASCGAAEGVNASDVWSQPVPPVSPASAVFLQISNGLDSTVTLTGATSDSCDSIELHETLISDAGVMAMRPMVPGLVLAPGESAALEPSGMHLMCIHPEVFEGSYDLTLTLDGAPDIDIAVTIEDR